MTSSHFRPTPPETDRGADTRYPQRLQHTHLPPIEQSLSSPAGSDDDEAGMSAGGIPLSPASRRRRLPSSVFAVSWMVLVVVRIQRFGVWRRGWEGGERR